MPLNQHFLTLAFVLTAISSALSQPVITLQPQSQTNVLGTTSEFSVAATGAAPLSYQWSFGSPPLRLDAATNALLVITNVQFANQGTYRVVITNVEGATTSIVANLLITSPASLQFSASNYTVAEDAGAAMVNVLRGTDDSNATVTVDFATLDGTATNGLAYQATNGTLTFAPGERVKRLTIPILNDGVKEKTRTFRLTLSNPSSGAVLGSPASTTVSILDNDPGVGFDRLAYTNDWSQAGDFTVTVLRGSDWVLGPITVNYTTANLTATAGQDYQAVSGTLEFLPNETIKVINIPILRNRAAPAAKSFRVGLSNPTGGATLGTASATVNIRGAYASLAPAFDTALSLQHEGGLNTISWSGAGQLQRADHPTGPWQTLLNATNPYTVQSPVPTTFYRVTRPRPVSLYIPSAYNGQTNLPLVILLHGYGHTGASQESYMRFEPLAESRSFLYCYPESTPVPTGGWSWTATDACCDFYGTGIDDAGYLASMIQEIQRRFTVDPRRIFLIGHSAGGFMAYRMACQFADSIAGIASLNGTTFLDPTKCAPSRPVNILHIHDTADDTVPYAGGAFTNPNMPPFPGALQTVQFWAGYNSATNPVTDLAPSMHLDLIDPGLDTLITRYANYPPGGAVELWTIVGGSHVPTLYSGSSSSEFAPRVIDWLLAHPKP